MTTAFQLASDLVDDFCELDPLLSTQLGIPGRDHEWGPMLGIDGIERAQEMRSGYRPLIARFVDSGANSERLAAKVMISSFDEAQNAHEARDHLRDLRHMASRFHRIRSIFDVMPIDSAEARQNILRRLETIDQPLADYRGLLENGLAEGVVSAGRQVKSLISQAHRLAREPASIDEVVGKVETAGGAAGDLSQAAETARAAFGEFAVWLESEYLPNAEADDGVGPDVYVRAANRLVGLEVDPDEAYTWGWEEFVRLLSELKRVANQIRPGDSVEATKEFLETDPSVTVSGTGALVVFVEQTLARAVDDLAGSHFEVPDEIRPLTVQIAPPGGPLGVHYMRPSEDFSRPGGVWYSIGDQEIFPVYQHVSTAYHEGFPGHHLQIATAMHRRDDISRYQRLMTWCPGYGEGWGMYAEVLMGELGYLENPQYYFGMLAKQMYRTARVVVDIGLHLGKTIPDTSPLFPGDAWSFDHAVEFMRVYGFRTADQARDEVLRYLGWPGQAIAYKLGEREILAIRQETRDRLGSAFDLSDFHSSVIGHGAMRLDLLREVASDRQAE